MDYRPKRNKQKKNVRLVPKRISVPNVFVLSKMTKYAFFGFIGLILITIVAFIWYGMRLPKPGEIVNSKYSDATHIYDRKGVLLYSVYSEQNRTYEKLDNISKDLQHATVAVEDKDFYKNNGFDPLSPFRIIYNLILKRRIIGGSGITQQLVKNVLLSADRTPARKIQELILAIQVDNKFSKDQILEMYLNNIGYGGTSVGVEAGKHVRLDEVLYPIMQGYDSYFMDTDVQVGGTDQTFNMQAGRTLQKNLRQKESFVLSTEFLTGTDGRKMSKSWGNAIWLSDTPEDMYAKVMAVRDDLIPEYYTLGTNVPLEEVDEIKKQLASGENPMNMKKQLAFIIVKELHGEKGAEKGKEYFERTVQKKELPIDIPEVTFDDKTRKLEDFIFELGLTPSKSEAKRLIEQGGVEIDNERKTNTNETIQPKSGMLVKAGKRKIIKIKI